jgi:hypothetical protein
VISAADLARRLARDAEAVCRHYLSNGHRQGRYWVIGDVMNTPGRSLYVRLTGPDSGPGAAGKWTDAATGEHGDLLDLIRLNRNLNGLGEAMDEARGFLALPRPSITSPTNLGHVPPAASSSSGAAQRLFHAGRPVPGTPAEAYLRARGITGRLDWPALRYHPSVYYRASRPAPAKAGDAPLETWPALLAAVTDIDGNVTGIQRTWLDPRRSTKAPLADPRRALGHLLGNGVRFGRASDIFAIGEGVETMLALKSVLPSLPVIAGLSANHLAALDLPPAPRSGPGHLCSVSMSPATTTRPVSRRRKGCTNAASPPGSKSASSCRSMATSTSISAVSAPRACGRILRISSSPPTGRAFCPISAAPIRGGEFHRHFGSFGGVPEEGAAFRLPAATCLGPDERGAARRPSRAAICRRRSRVAMAPASYFPPPGDRQTDTNIGEPAISPALHREAK